MEKPPIVTVSDLVERLLSLPQDWPVELDNEAWGTSISDVLSEDGKIVITYK